MLSLSKQMLERSYLHQYESDNCTPALYVHLSPWIHRLKENYINKLYNMLSWFMFKFVLGFGSRCFWKLYLGFILFFSSWRAELLSRFHTMLESRKKSWSRNCYLIYQLYPWDAEYCIEHISVCHQMCLYRELSVFYIYTV